MINKNWVSWCWQLGVFGAMVAGAIASGFECAQAQSKIVPDSTLGPESSVVLPYNGLTIEVINGGAIRGGNLFHSFLEFNVSSGRGAYFFSPNVNIQNILARVTGSNRSEILGTLGTYGNSNPNLFLINPNGIIFGANASLNIGGSFVATTANAVRLGDTGLFSASQPTSSNLLSVNPSAFLFNAVSNPKPIIVNSFTTGLQVPDGRSLLLLGGDVQLDGGTLFAADGRVELGSVSGTGTVGLNINGNYLSLSFPQQVQLADVSLTNGSNIEVDASDGDSTGINASNQDILGGINITARSLALTNGAGLSTSTSGQGNAGSITINARDTVKLDGVTSDGSSPSAVLSDVLEGAVGNGGNINIATGSLTVRNGAILETTTHGQGNAGSITINARDLVSLDRVNSDPSLSSVGSAVLPNVLGNGGEINITTASLALTNGAGVGTSTEGQGNAGSITINARDTVSFDQSRAFSRVEQGAKGKAGDINITTDELALTHGAQLDTTTYGQASAGNVTINARDTVTFDGSSAISKVEQGAKGKAGDINITTGELALIHGAQLDTNTFGQGSAGNVTINARDTVTFDGTLSEALSRVETGAVGTGGDIDITTGSLTVRNGAQLIASTVGQGNAGNVTINARDTVNFDGKDSDDSPSGAFSRVNSTGVGKGGTIDITTGSLTLTNGAQLSARTEGQGNAGNVKINAQDTITFDGTFDTTDATVSHSGAFSRVNSTGVGKGGTIDIITGSLTVRNGAQVSALTEAQGSAGSVTINARDTLQLNNGEIFTNATDNATSAEGGNVTITAKDIRLRNNSGINTFLSSGQGSGGNITLTANTILALENSDILTFAPQGRGGNITFHTRAFFSDPLYRPSATTTEEATFESFNNNGRVDVNASGAVSGAITGLPDISFIQNSLTELPQNLINPNVLIANSCIARSSKQQGTFTITGAGGLPNRPGDAVLSTYPTGDVRSVPSGALSRPWHKGDPIVEAQGLYHLPSGQLVLSRECQE